MNRGEPIRSNAGVSGPKLYLASRSPRRRELLAQMGIDFEQLPDEDSAADEMPHPGEIPERYVERIARAKAEHGRNVLGRCQRTPYLVLAADTTVELDGGIIGKPVDSNDALDILRRLSGRTHRVLTAVAVAFGDTVESSVSVSEVSFGTIDDGSLLRYVASGEPLDKAGAYGIQGRAGVFVRHLSGSYSGVMGLPLYETAQLLQRFDFPPRRD
ncbi:MAG: Maf family nucleotide pyrophosphatase [Candidatus Accumulibacter sp.]|nr:Maf family nucleotide pyrophosphatase [Accumulibacter sp.]